MKVKSVAAFLLFTPISFGAVLYTTDFPGTSGTPSNWTALAGSTGWAMNSGGNYQYVDPGAVTNGLTHYTGNLSTSLPASTLTNFTIETSFTQVSSGGGVAGLAGRILDASNFYHARLLGDNQFQIYKFQGGTATQLGSTVTLAAADIYTSGETWSISMTFNGSQISANLFNELGVQVATLSVTDSAFSSGTAGIRSQSNYAYDHFTITDAIPEPSTAALALLGGLAFAGKRRRSE